LTLFPVIAGRKARSAVFTHRDPAIHSAVQQAETLHGWHRNSGLPELRTLYATQVG
jgi:hypothetical protein